MNEEYITLICNFCNRSYKKQKKIFKNKKNANKYCSLACNGISKQKRFEKACKNCNVVVFKTSAQLKKSNGSVFCSKSCAATYNNTHKTKGNNRSKLEIWLEENLKNKYREIEFRFNDKEIINSELDIYIPEYKLAFELNGIFHYKPIFGIEKFFSIKENDNQKMQACLAHQIELCIIDTSEQKYFKIATSQKYLETICNILDGRMKSRSPYLD